VGGYWANLTFGKFLCLASPAFSDHVNLVSYWHLCVLLNPARKYEERLCEPLSFKLVIAYKLLATLTLPLQRRVRDKRLMRTQIAKPSVV